MTAPAAPPHRSSARAARLPHGAMLACAAALGGCSVFTTMYATPGPKPDVHPLPVTGTDLFDWKGVIHCHSYLSHDSKGTIAEIAAACRRASVDFVAMTDHQTDASIRDGQRGMVGDTLFMVGCEQRCPQGTIMAFPLTTPIKRWQHAGLLIKDTEAQGGVAFTCHAELWKAWDQPGLEGLTGVEIVNLHGDRHDYPAVQVDALIELCRSILARHPAIVPRNVVGHSDVAPRRKVDPGLRFPWARLATAGIGLWPRAGARPVDGDMQTALQRFGYPPAADDVTTSDIIATFQRRFRPSREDGIADRETRALLADLLEQVGEQP